MLITSWVASQKVSSKSVEAFLSVHKSNTLKFIGTTKICVEFAVLKQSPHLQIDSWGAGMMFQSNMNLCGMVMETRNTR